MAMSSHPRHPRSSGVPSRTGDKEGAQRLSSTGTVWWRDIFPRVWTVGVGMGMIGLWMGWWGHPGPREVMALAAVLWAGTSILVTLFGRSLYDVWLDGHRLIVSKDGRTVEIPLQDIMGFSESRAQKIKTIRVKLRPGSPLEEGIRFVPPLHFQAPFSEHPVIREIQERKGELAQGSETRRLR